MGSGVDLELYVDSEFATRDTNRRSVSRGVVMCAGACVSSFSRTQESVTLSSTEESMLRWPWGSRRRLFYGLSGVLSSRTATLDALSQGG